MNDDIKTGVTLADDHKLVVDLELLEQIRKSDPERWMLLTPAQRMGAEPVSDAKKNKVYPAPSSLIMT